VSEPVVIVWGDSTPVPASIGESVLVVGVSPAGAPGPPGVAGPPGVGVWRGAYDADTAYADGDLVSHDGSTWMATAATTGSVPPAAPWDLVALAGEPGPEGEDGPPGVVAADAPATYDPGTQTIGVAVGTTAGTVAAGDDARFAPTVFAEAVQDTVGAMATDGTTVNFTYDDTAGTLTAEVQGLTSANVSDFAEAVRDRLGATLVAGTGITVTVDDPGDTVTVASTVTQYTDEQARDALGSALVAGNNIDITVDDGADTITVAVESLTSADVGDFAEAVDDRVAALLVAGSDVTLTYDDGANTLTVAATGGGVTDGDKGDITVSGGGATWTVDNNAITLAKLADIATARILGRVTAGSGDPEELTPAQTRTLLMPLLHVRDEKASGTGGGTFTAGAWQVRTLNTVKTNEITGASLAADVVTLPAGTYEADASAPCFSVNRHQARVYNVTGAAVLLEGQNAYAAAADNASVPSRVVGRFTLAVQSDVRLEHRCETSRSTNGFGVENSFGGTQVYADMMIRKVA
jgi:hypothetical protein